MSTVIEKAKENAKALGITSVLTLFALFGVFFSFDAIYARAASVEVMQQQIEQRLDSQEKTLKDRLDERDIADLEDKILIIDMKEHQTQTDQALRRRYEARLNALRK